MNVAARAEGPGKRRALLICNGVYADGSIFQLPGVAKDHVAMKAALTDPRAGFEVTDLLDAGFLEVREAIARTCAHCDSADTLLFYYSGSSFRGSDGSLYLPVRDSNQEFADATTIETDFILRQLRQSDCRRILLLVDGCNAGAFFVNNRGIPDGLCAITACAADQTTEDTKDGGAFTCALIAALDDPSTDIDGDGQISVDELYQRVKETLAEAGRSSVPQKWVWNVREPIYVSSSLPTVFLSYARGDVDLAKMIREELERRGFDVWFDLEGIRSGDWKARVTRGLNRSRCVVFVMTENSLRSEAVRKELQFATPRGIPVIPITLKEWPDAALSDWYGFDYGTIHRRLLDPSAMGASLDDLAVAIREARRSEATSPP